MDERLGVAVRGWRLLLVLPALSSNAFRPTSCEARTEDEILVVRSVYIIFT